MIAKALVGAAVGGFIGVFAGTIWFGLSMDSAQSELVAVFVGGPVGALIGAALAAGWDVSTSERNQIRQPSINTASIAVAGLPGATLFVIVIAIALAFPAIKWLLTASLAAGVLLGIVLIVRHR